LLPLFEKLPLETFQGELFVPDFEKNICGVLPTAFELLDLSIPAKSAPYSFFRVEEGKKAISKNVLDFTDAPRHVVNVLIDSWGVGTLSSPHTLSTLFRNLHGFLISSVFPTITSSAVTSWHMGVPPKDHGILGHKILFEEVGSVVDTLKMQIVSGRGGRDSLVRIGIPPEIWTWNPPLYNEMEDSDVLHVELLSRGFAGTGVSHLVHPKNKTTIIIGCNDLVDIFATARELLLRAHQKHKLLINIYLGELDWLAHKFHPQSSESGVCLENISNALKWFVFSTPDAILNDTAVTFSADHGQVDCAQEPPVLFSQAHQDYMIRELLRTVPGRSGRMMHLYARPGKEDHLITYVKEIVGTRGVVISIDQAKSLLNVNDVSKSIRSRLGDVLVLLNPGTQFQFEYAQEDMEPPTPIDPSLLDFPMKGSHGALSFQELAVPYIISIGSLMKEILRSK